MEKVIVIGGSSGSIPVLVSIIKAVPVHYKIPIIIVVHRMKNVDSDLKNVLSPLHDIIEPDDKEPVKEGYIYLAPQNYHLLVEETGTFSLDYSELVNYSRPSIDVTFASVAKVYRSGVLGILLSGANADGAEGLDQVTKAGGRALVQDPASAEYTEMPNSAIKLLGNANILTPKLIVNEILKYPHTQT